MIGFVFAALGITAGFAQAALLARTVRGAPNPLSFFARWLAVALVFAVSIRTGYLAVAAAAWIAGFAISSYFSYHRLRAPGRDETR